jgi:hypothetical protein
MRNPCLIALAAATLALAGAPSSHAQATLGGGKGGTTFPIVISQPGSYKLAGNLTVPAGVNGIEVTTSHVVIDLNGFTISGPVVCSGAYHSISCTPGHNGITLTNANAMHTTVRNGSVRGFGVGVSLGHSGLAENLALTGNAQYGLVAHDGSLVRAVRASYNGSAGMLVNQGVVRDSFSSYAPQGFLMTGGLLATSSTAWTSWAVNGAYGGPNVMLGVRESVLRSEGTPMSGSVRSLGDNLCNGVAC